MFVPHQPGTSIPWPQLLHRRQESFGLKLDRLGEKATSTSMQHLGQGIVDHIRLTKPHNAGKVLILRENLLRDLNLVDDGR
jgi:hypothetical protein